MGFLGRHPFRDQVAVYADRTAACGLPSFLIRRARAKHDGGNSKTSLLVLLPAQEAGCPRAPPTSAPAVPRRARSECLLWRRAPVGVQDPKIAEFTQVLLLPRCRRPAAAHRRSVERAVMYVDFW